MAYELFVMTRIEKPADEVWAWMSDARNVLGLNMFHEAVLWDEPITEAGPRVSVPHSFFGLKQQRMVHVRDHKKYLVGFGETKSKDEPGVDPFPHYQSFEILPSHDGTCVVVNRIRGLYQFPGANLLGERIFYRWTPSILEDDNANLAVAVGAMKPEDKPRIKGALRLWPIWISAAKLLNATSRRKIVKRQKKKAIKAPADGNGAAAAAVEDTASTGGSR